MLISYHHIIKSYLFITQMLQNILESPASEGTETTQTNSGIDNFAAPFARCKGDTGQFLDNISSGDQSKDPLILDNCKDKSGGQSPACKKMVPSPSSSGVVTTPKSQGVPYPSEGDATATSASHQPDRLMRKWEIFPGRNKFLCDGRCIMAVNTGIFYFTISLIVITVSLFFAFECRLTLVSEISFGFFIPIGCGVLFLFNLACLLRTAWSDPGIIPRATPEESAYMEKMLQDSVPKDEGLGGYRPPPRTQEVTVNGVTIKLKYCFTCKIFRPPRASHCSLCDNCVENFDHHCPWVGNCVGRRNYRYFFLFVTSLSILCIYIFVFSVVHIVLLSKRENGFLNALKLSPGSVLEVLICFFSVWSVVGLSGFHSYLIATGLTTNEDIKGTWSKKRNRSNVNPFDRGGWVQNCVYQLCTPVPVSSINRRARVTPEELARRETQLQRQTSMNGANRTYGTASMSPSKPGTSSFVPGADRETYDSSQALYPRQPNYPTTPSQQFPASAPPSTNSLSHQQQQPEVSAGTTPGEATSATPESNQTTAAVTITHYPIVNNTSVVHASYNRNNSTTTSPHAMDVDIEQPDVIVEHLPHLLDTSVLSTDSRTLLLKDNPPGVTGSESPTPPPPAAANPAKSGKISSV